MKNLIIILILVFSFVALDANAQIADDKKGPMVKNYKPWKNPTPPKEVLVKSSKKKMMGPKFKNQKPGKVRKYLVIKEANTSTADKKVMGPKAKNRRP